MSSKDVIPGRIAELTNYVEHSLKLVEAKHGSLIVLCTACIFGLVEHFSRPSSLYEIILLVAALVPLLIATGMSVWAFYPVRSRQRTDSFIFRCENLEFYSAKDLVDRLMSREETEQRHVYDELDEFDRQRIERVLRSSRVVARKYRLFRRALFFFGLFACLFSIILIIKFI